MEENENIDTLLAMINLRLRLADAHWLYATMGAAQTHAPSSEYASQDAQSVVDALIDKPYETGVSKTTFDQLKQWSSLTFATISEQEYASVDAHDLEKLPETQAFDNHLIPINKRRRLV